MKLVALLCALSLPVYARRPTIEQTASVTAAGLSMVASGKQIMAGWHKTVKVAKKAVKGKPAPAVPVKRVRCYAADGSPACKP